MLSNKRSLKQLFAVGVFVGGLVVSSGCQTWRSSAALPGGVSAKKNQREVLKNAKKDPFPSPSDVGMTMTK